MVFNQWVLLCCCKERGLEAGHRPRDKTSCHRSLGSAPVGSRSSAAAWGAVPGPQKKKGEGEKRAARAKRLEAAWRGGLAGPWCCCWPCAAAPGRLGSSATAGRAARSAGTAASSAPSAPMAPGPRCAAGPAACATAARPARPAWTRAAVPATARSPAPGLLPQVSLPSLWQMAGAYRTRFLLCSPWGNLLWWDQADPASGSPPFRAPGWDHGSSTERSPGTALTAAARARATPFPSLGAGNNPGRRSEDSSVSPTLRKASQLLTK